ncbi:MAG: hypothetical protein OXH57_03790 [Ekhidna sp.]|nr:hypothetical protein [Ekhidna sp.]
MIESKDSDYEVYYALKANTETKIASRIQEYGLGVDHVSVGEIQYVLNHGFEGSQIVYAGVGKNEGEISLAAGHEVTGINCESIEELAIIHQVAHSLDKEANIF